MTQAIDGSRLTNKALDILLADLQKHGNVVSEMHQDALYELLETLSGYASGDVNGRRAFGLPTGTGKTSAIVAFVTACHELDYEVPISISASRTEALCRLKRDLLAKGVPPEWVGLKHATAGASEESSEKPHLVQLVTHSRVRGGKEKDFELFGMYREQPHRVCIYDESLLRGNGGSVNYQLTYEALGALMHTDAFKKSADVQLAARFIGDCCDVASAAITQLDETGDSEGFGVLVQFPKKEDVEVDGFKVSIAAAIRGENEEHLQALLRICQDDSLRILMTGQGTGIIWSTEAVPAELDRICILDASHSIRTLISLDKTITSACSFHDLPLKTFEAVEVVQIVGGGGNTTLTDRFRKDRHATAQEFVAVIRENWQTSHGILLFTYLPKRIDMRKAIEAELTKAELDATVEVMRDGVATLEKKLQWRTWGSHEGENSLEFCNVVLAVGVMQRGFLDIASAAQAQTLDSRFPTPHSLIEKLVESEAASALYQAASRGSCRRVNNGAANGMRLYFLHKSPTIKALLDKVMPGARWTFRTPTHLKAAKHEGVAYQMSALILDYLRGLDESIVKVSSRVIKAALGLKPGDTAQESAFTRARLLVSDFGNSGWTIQGKSLVRWSEVFGTS